MSKIIFTVASALAAAADGIQVAIKEGCPKGKDCPKEQLEGGIVQDKREREERIELFDDDATATGAGTVALAMDYGARNAETLALTSYHSRRG